MDAKLDSALSHGGQLGRLIRGHDWSRTSLGPIATWPQSLKTAVRICVESLAEIDRAKSADDLERKRTENRLLEQAQLLDESHDAILVFDDRARITYWNKGATALYGYSYDEAVGRMSHELLQTVFPEPLGQIMETVRRSASWSGELVHTRKDGAKVIVSSRWALDETGRGSTLEINRDITEQKRIQQALRLSERRLRLALAAGRLATWDWDVRSGAIVWNDEHYRILGYEPGSVQPSYEAWLNRVHPEDARKAEARVLKSRDEGGRYQMEYRIQWPGGRVRWVEAHGQFEPGGRLLRQYGVMWDVTERKLASESRRETAILEERQRIARDIHDTLAQGFTGIVLNLEAIEEVSEDLSFEARDRITRAKNLARSSLEEARRSVLALALPREDLMSSIRELVDRFRMNGKTRMELSVSGIPCSLAPGAADNVVRVIQQALDNAQQHARATMIRVEAAFGPKQVRIRIRDNGRGFEVSHSNDRFGLKSMRDRAMEIGAEFRLKSRPGRGTQIDFTIPISFLSPTSIRAVRHSHREGSSRVPVRPALLR